MNQLSMRAMAPGDAAEVIELWKDSGIQRRPSKRALSRFLSIGVGKVAELEGKLVAATTFGICGPTTAYFEKFAVLGTHRRRGIGRALYGSCTQELYASGIRLIVFLVNDDNAVGRAFWNAIGAMEIRRATPYYEKLLKADSRSS